jgi:hypothetical protein
MEKIPLAEFRVEWSGNQALALHFAMFLGPCGDFEGTPLKV